jgi:Family of unknown function (DUF6350)
MAEQGDPRLGPLPVQEAVRAAVDAVRRQAALHLPDVALGLVAALCVAAVGWLAAVAITFAVWIPTAPSGGAVATPFHVSGQLWLAAHHVLLRTPDGLFGLTPLGFTLLPATALVLAGRYIGHRFGPLPDEGPYTGAESGVIAAAQRDLVAATDCDYDADEDDADVAAGPGAHSSTYAIGYADARTRAGADFPEGAAEISRSTFLVRSARPFDVSVLWLLGAAVAGYELCAALIAWTAAAGPLHADLGACASYPPLLAAIGLGAGFLSVCRPALEHWAAVAARAAATASAVLVCGAAALAVLALALRFCAIGGAGHSLGGGAGAEIGLFLIDLALLPNLIGWAVSFLVGPGFAIGTGSSVSMFGSAHGPLPSLPVLGAVPVPGPLSSWLLAAGLVPLLAGAAATVLVLRLVRPWPDRFAALAAAAVATGLGCGLFCALSGGPVADGVLAVTGPAGWQVGLVASGLIALVGLAGFGLVAASAAARSRAARAAAAAFPGPAERLGEVVDVPRSDEFLAAEPGAAAAVLPVFPGRGPGADPAPGGPSPTAPVPLALPAFPVVPTALTAPFVPVDQAPAEPGPVALLPAGSSPDTAVRPESAPDDQGAADLVGEGAVVAVPERGEETRTAGQAVDDVGERTDEGAAEAGGLQGGLLEHPDADGLLAERLPGGALLVELPQADGEGPGVAQKQDEDPGPGRSAEGDQVSGAVVGGRLDALEEGDHAAHGQRAHEQEIDQGGADPGSPGGQIDV